MSIVPRNLHSKNRLNPGDPTAKVDQSESFLIQKRKHLKTFFQHARKRGRVNLLSGCGLLPGTGRISVFVCS